MAYRLGAITLGVTLAVAGCVPQDHPAERRPTTPGVESSIEPLRTSPGQVVLRCRDAVASTTGDGGSRRGALVIDDVVIESWGPAGSPMSPAADVLTSVPSTDRRYFAKAPVQLPPASGPVSIRVIEPRGVTLGWVPGYLWTDPRRDYSLADYESRWVTFAGCGGAATYLGGVLSTESSTCATFEITTARRGRTRVVVALGQADCDASR